MRLELLVTERDKRLLMLTGIVGVLTLSVRFLIWPAFERGRNLEGGVAEVSAAYEERLASKNKLNELNEIIEQRRPALDEACKRYYKPLAAWELDALVTELAVRHGLLPENLSLTGAVQGMVEPYIFAPEDETEDEFLENAGVMLANVQLEASGETPQWQAFLDDVSRNYPALRVTRFSAMAKGERGSKTNLKDRFVCTLEIYICRNGQEDEY